MSHPPKAFISHASDDKERFVVHFAKRLRELGIEAWLDKWEIKLGDSLIDKIFDEGIKSADVFIVVLSPISVTKPWVKEELNSGLVRRIEKHCRIIPVVIEGCEIPVALNHLKRISIRDLANCDGQIREIANEIHGFSEKPEVRRPPRHVEVEAVDYLPDLTKLDNLVFATLCRSFFANNSYGVFLTKGAYDEMIALGYTDDQVTESIELLLERGHLYDPGRVLGNSRILYVRMSLSSADVFMRDYIEDYEQCAMSVVAAIVNDELQGYDDITEKTGLSLDVVSYLVELLESKGLVEVNHSSSGGFVWSVSTSLKRKLSN